MAALSVEPLTWRATARDVYSSGVCCAPPGAVSDASGFIFLFLRGMYAVREVECFSSVNPCARGWGLRRVSATWCVVRAVML